MHALNDGQHLRVKSCPPQAIGQQGGNDWLTFDHIDRATEASQDESITPQSCRGIENAGPDAGLQTHGFGDHLTATPAKLPPMRQRPLNKIHPQRPRRILGQIL
jgi:hypothetical protein